MQSTIRPAVVMLALFTVLTGLLYPLLITGAAQVLLPSGSNGSLIMRDERVVGSTLIGQQFAADRYFHPRPSAAGKDGYDAAGSSGSNLGPLSKKLIERVSQDVAALRPHTKGRIPADAVTTSASGLDPHISPANALLQVERVASARKIPADRVRDIVRQSTETPLFGIFGEPRVNVLVLNLALDAALGAGAG